MYLLKPMCQRKILIFMLCILMKNKDLSAVIYQHKRTNCEWREKKKTIVKAYVCSKARGVRETHTHARTHACTHLYGPRLDLFKTSISIAGASLWNSPPQNIKSCISLPCFKRNLHKYMSENNLSSNLYDFA